MESFSAIEFDLKQEEEEKSLAVHSTSVGENQDRKKNKRFSDSRPIKQNECLYYTEWHFPQSPEKAIKA